MFEDVYFDISIDRLPMNKRREFTKVLRAMTGQKVVDCSCDKYRLVFWNEYYNIFDAYSGNTDSREHWKSLLLLRDRKEAPLKEDLGCL